MYVSKCHKAALNEVSSPINPDQTVYVCSVCSKPAQGNAIHTSQLNPEPTPAERAAIKERDRNKANNRLEVKKDFSIWDVEEGRDPVYVGKGDDREMAESVCKHYMTVAIVKNGIHFEEDAVIEKNLTDKDWFKRRFGKDSTIEKDALSQLRTTLTD